MEKDIEILEKYIKDKTIKTMGALVTPDKEELQAIENLINRVKELEQQYDKLSRHFIQNHVSKDKIKEKIKELEKQKDNEYLTNYYGTKEPQRLKEFQYKIQVLQDLLN